MIKQGEEFNFPDGGINFTKGLIETAKNDGVKDRYVNSPVQIAKQNPAAVQAFIEKQKQAEAEAKALAEAEMHAQQQPTQQVEAPTVIQSEAPQAVVNNPSSQEEAEILNMLENKLTTPQAENAQPTENVNTPQETPNQVDTYEVNEKPSEDETELGKWKHYSRKNEEALKFAQQRENEAIQKALSMEQALQSEKLNNYKLEAIMKNGLSIDALPLIDGVSTEEIDNKINTLSSLVPNLKKAPAFSANPLQGAVDSGAVNQSPESIIASIATAQGWNS